MNRFSDFNPEDPETPLFEGDTSSPRMRTNTVRTRPALEQILPADGWSVILQFNFQKVAFPLACWGVVKDERGLFRVIGMIPIGRKVTYVDELPNFRSYLPPAWTVGMYDDFLNSD